MEQEVMMPKYISLGQGVSLEAVQTDRFKTACLSVSSAVTATAALSPIDTLLLGVQGRGNANYETLYALNKEMDLLYDLTLFSRNYRMGDLQILGSGAYFIDPKYLPASDRETVAKANVRMLRESIYAPLLDDGGCFRRGYTELEKKVQTDIIRDEIREPGAYAEKRIRELTFLCEPHGVSFYGTVDGVNALSSREITDRYHAFWKNAPLHFFYVGSESPERMAEMLSDAFSLHTVCPDTTGKIAHASPSSMLPFTGNTSRFDETLPVSQGKLCMVLSVDTDLRSKDLYIAMVCNEILGGSPLSKLFMNVREKKGLCYYCSSVFDFYKGYFSISAGIRVDNRNETEEEILLQLEEMRKGNISDAEMTAAVRFLVSIYTGLYDSSSGIENYYLARRFYGVRSTPEEAKAAILRVTKEDVVAFMQRVRLRSVYFLCGTGNAEGEEDDEE